MTRDKDTPSERYTKDVNGMPCFAAKTAMQIFLGPESLKNAVAADDEACAIAQGCKIQLQTPFVSVGRRRTDLALPHPDGVVKQGYGNTKWAVIRFQNSAGAMRVIIAADTYTLNREDGVQVELLPPRKSDRPDRTPRSGPVTGKGKKLAGKGQNKLTLAGVRNLSGSRR